MAPKRLETRAAAAMGGTVTIGEKGLAAGIGSETSRFDASNGALFVGIRRVAGDADRPDNLAVVITYHGRHPVPRQIHRRAP